MSPPEQTTDAGRPARRPRRSVAAAVVALVALGVALAAACSSGPTVDREQAIDKVVADGQGQLTKDQATCYVNRVIDEVGIEQLQPDTEPTPNQVAKLTSIRIDCVGVANLGVFVPGTGTSLGAAETLARRVPMHLGDDAPLDELARNCQRGDGASCDSLFDLSAPGSDYEELGVTCGNRTREKRCADAYGTATTVPGTPSPPSTR